MKHVLAVVENKVFIFGELYAQQKNYPVLFTGTYKDCELARATESYLKLKIVLEPSMTKTGMAEIIKVSSSVFGGEVKSSIKPITEAKIEELLNEDGLKLVISETEKHTLKLQNAFSK